MADPKNMLKNLVIQMAQNLIDNSDYKPRLKDADSLNKAMGSYTDKLYLEIVLAVRNVILLHIKDSNSADLENSQSENCPNNSS